MFHFLFPSHPLEPQRPDELFEAQFGEMAARGFSVSHFSEDVLRERRRLKGIPPGSEVVYRGWMLDPDEYGALVQAIESADGTATISRSEYLAAHHLPNWYPRISDLTPETRIYPVDAEMTKELSTLDWGSYFVKDYVKSLKTSVGSIAREPSQVDAILEEMRAYRGRIEGGICIRRVEDFLPETEERYFVLGGRPFAPDPAAPIPEPVALCARRIPSKFFSVDVVCRRDGVLRVVEIGDGQVSDLVGWSPEAFAEIWARFAP